MWKIHAIGSGGGGRLCRRPLFDSLEVFQREHDGEGQLQGPAAKAS